MPDCGINEFMRGGTLTEARVVASDIVDSRMSSSVLENCQVRTLGSVDESSAATIANAIAALSEDALSALAKAITAAMPAAKVTSSPEATAESQLPTSVVGNRESLLGRPEVWLEYQGFAIPAFREGK